MIIKLVDVTVQGRTQLSHTIKLSTANQFHLLGTSRNAVLSQVWIALCVYLLIAYLNFKANLGNSMQQILRVLQLNLFEQRALADLFRPPDKQQPVSPQLLLWGQL